MLPFKLVYSDAYYLPLGEHIFPAEKYRLVHRRLLEHGVASPADFLEPTPASQDDVLLVHTQEYVRKLVSDGLTPREQLEMEIPYSPDLVRAFWLAAGGSIVAAELALRDGVGFNLGGGFHHAYPDHGEGFCMINDVAIAIRRMQKDGKVRRAMTVDCDVHQGNGTALAFLPAGVPLEAVHFRNRPLYSTGPKAGGDRYDGDVFTISLHQENNYPALKPPSCIDVNLPDGAGDTEYLHWLDRALASGLRQFSPDLICYLAGADPYREDQLGGLNLTIEGLKQRDQALFRTAKEHGIPVMVTLAGGYALHLEDTVTIHCNTVEAAKEVFVI